MSTVFFLSTGRCGTQWLANALRATYDDLAVVTHEPIKYQYQPKRFLRAYDDMEALLADPVVGAHVARIRTVQDEGKTYIETGWPCYVAIPLFTHLFADHLKLVHLVRHPVPTAASLVTHDLYGGRTNVGVAEIDPSDPGVIQPELAAGWASMSRYEKCLFWWTEINRYALEIHERYPDVPFMTVHFEEMMSPTSGVLKSLTEFLEVPYRPSLTDSLAAPVDRYTRRTEQPIEWDQIQSYPQTMELANHFGYRFNTINGHRIVQRYRKKFLKRSILVTLRWMGLENTLKHVRNAVVKKWKRHRRVHPSG